MNQKSKMEYIAQDDLSVKELILKGVSWFRYMMSNWPIIVAACILGSILGFTYAYSKKGVYIASTTFVLEEGSSGSGGLANLGGLASMVGVDLGGGNGSIFQGDNILELYKSRAMIERSLLSPMPGNGKDLIIDYYISINRLKKDWKGNPLLLNIKFPKMGSDFTRPHLTRLQDSILGVIVNNISLSNLDVSKPNKKLSIIRANVSSTDERFSKIFNDAIVWNVNNFYIKTKTKKSQQNVNILQEKTDSVRNVMNGAIYSAAAVGDATPNLNASRFAQRVAPVQKSQFNAETNKAVLTQLLTNLELSKMALLKETPLIQVIDQPYFPLSKEIVSKRKWMIIGFMLGLVLIVGFLTLKRIVTNIMV